jgi:hypothetical protein
MFTKALLFVIVCIFVYETFKTLYKQQEDYFETFNVDVNIKRDPPTPELLDINNTINANCTRYKLNKNNIRIMEYSPHEEANSLDTPYHAAFAPLIYNKARKYYGNPHFLIEEGKRRYMDDKMEIAKLKDKYDAELNPEKKIILGNELALFDWQNYILSQTNSNGEKRNIPDITTDYFPEVIGMNRPWIERHSHLPDYSRIENDKYFKVARPYTGKMRHIKANT